MNISKSTIKKSFFTLFVTLSLTSYGAAVSAVAALDNYKQLSKSMDKIEFAYTSTKIESNDSSNDIFYIRAFREIIGVFNSKNELLYTVNVQIKTLPLRDRKILEEGICANSYEELCEIIGDYNS